MAVSNEKIINKMIRELEMAKSSGTNLEKQVGYIKNVQLLCELIVEEQTNNSVSEDKVIESVPNEKKEAPKVSTNKVEGNNDYSIFDF